MPIGTKPIFVNANLLTVERAMHLEALAQAYGIKSYGEVIRLLIDQAWLAAGKPSAFMRVKRPKGEPKSVLL